MYPVIHSCPVCEHSLHVTKLACSNCHTTIENKFNLSHFSALSEEQLYFIEIFVIHRGNIKEVEKALGISYPTVRSKLNTIIQQLGHEKDEVRSESSQDENTRKAHIITQLENEEITAQGAIEQLKDNK